MIRKSPRRLRRGQAMVELALSLPLLLGVLAAVIELSILISHAQALQEAVNQAARGAAESETTIEVIKLRVASFLEGDKLLEQDDLTIDVEESVDFNGSPTITITAHMTMRPFAFANLGSFKASATATYRKEWGDELP